MSVELNGEKEQVGQLEEERIEWWVDYISLSVGPGESGVFVADGWLDFVSGEEIIRRLNEKSGSQAFSGVLVADRNELHITRQNSPQR